MSFGPQTVRLLSESVILFLAAHAKLLSKQIFDV